MVTDSPHAAQIALLLMFFPTSSQLLLCHGHLLLHVGDLFPGAATVLLVEADNEDKGGFESLRQIAVTASVWTHDTSLTERQQQPSPI